jgi:hypothetical protein
VLVTLCDVMGAINFVLGAFLRVDFVVLPLFVQGEVPALFCAGAEQDWPMCSPCLQHTNFSGTEWSRYISPDVTFATFQWHGVV